MHATRTAIRHFLFILFVFLQMNHSSYSQVSLDSPEKWAIALAVNGQQGNESYNRPDTILQNLDSLRSFQFLDQLANQKQNAGHHFIARFNCLKAS